MPRKYNIDFVNVIKWLLSSNRVLQMLQPDWLSYCTCARLTLLAFSAPEAALLLVSTKNRDLWPGALLWNSLPENIRAIRSIGQFKKEINRALKTSDSHSAIL